MGRVIELTEKGLYTTKTIFMWKYDTKIMKQQVRRYLYQAVANILSRLESEMKIKNNVSLHHNMEHSLYDESDKGFSCSTDQQFLSETISKIHKLKHFMLGYCMI